ncbi:MAG: urease accessory protein UreF [Leptolyngbyaceae cyanobacterium RU_5_1]|nr:urease accessory protein UreF [Leptolyngbyaceae cyanobacterium RU_5_1]
MSPSALLRLLQLASPTLPVGAYSYSEGLEALVDSGSINGSERLQHWLTQELRYGAVRLEAAIAVRGYHAAATGDLDKLVSWNQWLSAARETEELRSQSWQMGRSLLRLLHDLNLQASTDPPPSSLLRPPSSVLPPFHFLQEGCNFAIAYAIAAATWQIDLQSAVLGYLHSWATNLVSAGIKLIPLGQTTGQQVLLNLQPTLEQVTKEILTLQDDDLNSCGWGLALASMAHETQYSRLFRS